jgi:hypothetical protein
VFIYIGKNFTATVTGSVVREIQCERCESAYGYQLSRVAQGTASAPYYIAQGAAQRRAERSAAKRLAKLLEHDEELVPCPGCGHVHTRAVLAARRRSYKPLKSFGIGAIALGAAGAILTWIVAINEPSNRSIEGFVQFGLAMVGVSAFGGLLLLLRPALAKRFDPNAMPRGTWSPPPGTPPAIIPGQGAVEPEGAPQASMASPAGATDFVAGGTLPYASHPRCIVQIGRFTFPACCSLCLDESAPYPYKLPFSVRGDEIPLGLCQSCYSHVRRRAWKYMFLGACAGLVIALPIWLMPWAKDEGARIAFAILAGLFIGLFSAAYLPERRLRPCKLSTIDAQRGVVELWFANPKYGRRLMDDYRRTETSVPAHVPSILETQPPPPARAAGRR